MAAQLPNTTMSHGDRPRFEGNRMALEHRRLTLGNASFGNTSRTKAFTKVQVQNTVVLHAVVELAHVVNRRAAISVPANGPSTPRPTKPTRAPHVLGEQVAAGFFLLLQKDTFL